MEGKSGTAIRRLEDDDGRAGGTEERPEDEKKSRTGYINLLNELGNCSFWNNFIFPRNSFWKQFVEILQGLT